MLEALTGPVALSALVLAASVTDLRTRRIPNALTGAGAIAGAFWVGIGDPGALPERLTLCGAVALSLGALSLKRPEAFGMGDVKLIAVMALFIGWVAMPLVLVPALTGAASFGILLAVVRGLRPGSVALPLAPFLAVPTIVWAALEIPI